MCLPGMSLTRRVVVTYNCPSAVQPYLLALKHVGVEPVPVAAGELGRWSVDKALAFLDNMDGLLITGGLDVHSKRYGQDPHPSADRPNELRDELEFAMAEAAMELNVPLLGICRGMQLLNVACGGTLIQHLHSVSVHQVRPTDPWTIAHDVLVESDSVLYAALGRKANTGVNSRHHQAVDQLGSGLRVSARAPDGVVEAIEMPARRFVVGVQWHPENGVSRCESQTALFRTFVDAMGR